jgi:hypothetical protein
MVADIDSNYYITWIELILIALAVGAGSFLILKNKKNTSSHPNVCFTVRTGF